MSWRSWRVTTFGLAAVAAGALLASCGVINGVCAPVPLDGQARHTSPASPGPTVGFATVTSCASIATYQGKTYGVGAGTGLQLGVNRPVEVGHITAANDPSLFRDGVALRLPGIPTDVALLARASDSARTSMGDWLILWGSGEGFPAMCRYLPKEPGC